MKKLYEKSEIGFALMWIGIYCVGTSLFDNFSRAVGEENSLTAIFALTVSVYLFFWVRSQGLMKYFGLCKTEVSAGAFLFFIPLAIITTRNLWSGVNFNYDRMGTVCFVLKMLCVGFLEELIFRGFLFKAMCKDSVKWAVIVSSVTFGLGHIINLINGSGMSLGDNLFQIVSAVLIGFMYVVIFHRGGSLWPCIISHGLFNSFSAFVNRKAPSSEVTLLRILLCLLVLAYTLVLLKTLPKENNTES